MLLKKTAFTTFVLFLSLFIFKQVEVKDRNRLIRNQKTTAQNSDGFDFQQKNILNEKVRPSRAPASVSPAPQPQKKENIEELEQKYHSAFYEAKNNLEDLSLLQAKISTAKNKALLEIENIYKWDILFVYYLTIEESMNFDQINSLQSLDQLGFSLSTYHNLIITLNSEDFRKEISQFKGLVTITNEQKLAMNMAIAKTAESHAVIKKNVTEKEFNESLNSVKYTDSQRQEMLTGYYGNQSEEY